MATTQIMCINNFSGQVLKVTFREDSNHNCELSDDHSREQFYAPVPWCASADELKNKGLVISDAGGNVLYAIWQQQSTDGDYVRYSAGESWSKGSSTNQIPGHNETGGHIALVVDGNGNLRSAKLDWFRKKL